MPLQMLSHRIALFCRWASGALLGASLAALSGCAQVKLGAPVPSIENLQKAKAAVPTPLTIGDFTVDAGKEGASMDAGVSIRSNTVSSPVGGSFARYLQETLSMELKAAGLLSPSSDTLVRGALTDSQLDAGASQGKGALAARFMVERAGRSIYDQVLRVESTWDSSFVGAVAIPAAINQYTLLYRKLVGRLLDDPSFRAAIAN
jgi:hypothetical protein